MASPAEKLKNISDTQGQLPYKRVELPPYPEHLLKIVPEMAEFRRKEQSIFDEWVKSVNVAKAS